MSAPAAGAPSAPRIWCWWGTRVGVGDPLSALGEWHPEVFGPDRRTRPVWLRSLATRVGLTLLLVLLAGWFAAGAWAGPIGAAKALADRQPPAIGIDGVQAAPTTEGLVRRAEPRARFFALGDLPYFAADEAHLRRLLDTAAAGGAPFALHIGDIKGGSQPCTEAAFERIANLFRTAPLPIVYTPGDNEWTDCRRGTAGGHDPLERLAVLRRVMFDDPLVLRQGALRPVVPDPAYPENSYFVQNGVLIALVHVVGSENNHRRRDLAAMTEFRRRALANRALLERAVAAANVLGVEAVVVAFHANPMFEREPPHPAFLPLLTDLTQVLETYPGPVLVIHGDTHRFRFDQPTAHPRLWRLEVPGSPFVGGVWVGVDAAATPPFEVEVIYPSPLLGIEAD